MKERKKAKSIRYLTPLFLESFFYSHLIKMDNDYEEDELINVTVS
jgi:hypothetical protein